MRASATPSAPPRAGAALPSHSTSGIPTDRRKDPWSFASISPAPVERLGQQIPLGDDTQQPMIFNDRQVTGRAAPDRAVGEAGAVGGIRCDELGLHARTRALLV
jgi:hypothetical protein